MRLLFINQYFPPDASATAQLLGELSADLARYHDVWVLAGKPSYNARPEDRAVPGVRVVRSWSTAFGRSSMAGRTLNYVSFLASSLARSMALPRPDAVVALTDPPAIGFVGVLAARRYRAPLVYVCQDIFPDVGVALGRIRSDTLVRIWRTLNALIRREAVRIVAIGRDMVQKLEREGVPKEKVVLIRNWGDGEIPDDQVVARLRADLGWEGRFVVMHAGNLGLAQNPAAIVRAAAHPRMEGDVLIVFVGDGAARLDMQRLADRLGLRNVRFLPYRPKAEAQHLMAAADMHVVSLAPGLFGCVAPSKVYGIMAAGRPFVAAVDQGSEAALLLREHRCGLRVDPDDADALAEAILAIRGGDPEALGRRARAAFESGYRRETTTEAYRRLLEGLVESSSRPVPAIAASS